MTFTFGREEKIGRCLREKPKSFLDWEKIEGVLTPELCNQHKQEEGTPMLLDQATSRIVSGVTSPELFDRFEDAEKAGLEAAKSWVEQER
jgi:hypothetical protein